MLVEMVMIKVMMVENGDDYKGGNGDDGYSVIGRALRYSDDYYKGGGIYLIMIIW